MQNDQRHDFQLFSFAEFVFLSVFFIALLTGPQMLSIDSDLGRHLVLGDYILDNSTIPTRNILSFTLDGEPRPPYEWLAQMLFALAHRLLGLDGVILLTATLIGFTFAILFQHTNDRNKSPLIACILVFLAVAAASIHWLPRPHIVTIFLLVIWIDRLERLRREETSRLFAFPLIMLFWANLHGGFIFGFLAWGAYLTGWLWEKLRGTASSQAGRNLFLAGMYSLAASILTPDLWRSWEAVLNNRSTYILSRTAETMPPVLTDPTILPFTVLLLLTILLFSINWRILPPSHLFLLGGLGFISLLMARTIPLFAVAAVPILGELLQKSLARFNFWSHIEDRFAGFRTNERMSLIAFIPVLLAVMYFASYNRKNHLSIHEFSPQTFPVQAVDWLEENPQPGNMFNEFNWGGYLLYRLWPQQKVFLDSQSDFYGEPLMREYETIILAQGNWRILLEKYDVAWVIIPPGLPIAAELKKEDWIPRYEDETTVILVKK